MKSLPAPPIPKDASRAAKRIHSSQFEPVTQDSLNILLNLPGIRVTHFTIELNNNITHLHLSCEHDHAFASCPTCQKVSSNVYEYKSRSVRHLDILGMRTIIHFPHRRFECLVCGKPFTELLSWIDPKRRQTIAFEEHIYNRVKKTSRKHVAQEEGLSESSVLDIFKKKANQARRQLNHGLVRILGIDELLACNVYKQYILIISDLQRRCVIAVLPDRLQAVIARWIDSLSESQRKAIKVVSMDMWEPYRQIVKKKLPKVQIVADRFHVMKNLNHQLNLLRRKMQREADESLGKILKGSRWILVKNRSELSSDEEDKLQQILKASDELRALYLLKEEFRVICEKIDTKNRAEKFLRAWIYKAQATDSRYLIKFSKTLLNWWSEFLNYFEDRVTQGYVEGVNRAIRGIINRTFGFRNFKNLRLQILVEHGNT
jgi:transposase